MYSALVGIDKLFPALRGDSETCGSVLGRVAKICGVRTETFLQGNSAGSIDTFRVSMIKYNENKCLKKETRAMLSKMNAKPKNQFAAVFAVGFVFPFFCGKNFSR